jgi:hypothetical protein
VFGVALSSATFGCVASNSGRIGACLGVDDGVGIDTRTVCNALADLRPSLSYPRSNPCLAPLFGVLTRRSWSVSGDNGRRLFNADGTPRSGCSRASRFVQGR